MDKREAETTLGVEIEPCPCCISYDLSIGTMSFLEQGISCNRMANNKGSSARTDRYN